MANMLSTLRVLSRHAQKHAPHLASKLRTLVPFEPFLQAVSCMCTGSAPLDAFGKAVIASTLILLAKRMSPSSSSERLLEHTQVHLRYFCHMASEIEYAADPAAEVSIKRVAAVEGQEESQQQLPSFWSLALKGVRGYVALPHLVSLFDCMSQARRCRYTDDGAPQVQP